MAGHRPLPVNEPKPAPVAAGGLAAPRYLDRLGREAWERLVPELERLGLLTTLDVLPIARYCDLWSRWRRARAKLRKDLIDGKGSRRAETLIAKDCEAAMIKLESEFGMTPSSRTRIETDAEPLTAPTKATGTEGKSPSRFFRE